MADCTERSEGQEGTTRMRWSRLDLSASGVGGIRFPSGSRDRTVCADASIELAKGVGSVLFVVAASRRSEFRS
jgi:hypothetical protein